MFILFSSDTVNYLPQMKKPGLQAMVDGKTKSLYLHSPASIEEKLRPNLKKTVEGKLEVLYCRIFILFILLFIYVFFFCLWAMVSGPFVFLIFFSWPASVVKKK